MGEALRFLVIGVLGGLMIRYAVPTVAALERLNRATLRRIGLPGGPSALYGFMTVMLAGFGYLCILIAVVGLIAYAGGN